MPSAGSQTSNLLRNVVMCSFQTLCMALLLSEANIFKFRIVGFGTSA
jgi:type III secretory pathway component EscT